MWNASSYWPPVWAFGSPSRHCSSGAEALDAGSPKEMSMTLTREEKARETGRDRMRDEAAERGEMPPRGSEPKLYILTLSGEELEDLRGFMKGEFVRASLLAKVNSSCGVNRGTRAISLRYILVVSSAETSSLVPT